MPNIVTLTPKDLLQMQRSIPVPFEFSILLDDKPSTLCITQVLKVLPGKRVVGLAVFNNKQYFLKIFLGTRRAEKCQQDLTGIVEISQRKIKTPAVIASGKSADGNANFILFEYLEDAQDLAQLLSSADDSGYSALLQQAIDVIINGYQQGILQQDIHLANFLISEGQLYWIDGAEVQAFTGESLSIDRMLENFALFFAQFSLNNDQHIASGLEQMNRVYESRHLPINTNLKLEMFVSMVNKYRQGILSKYRNKVCRDSSVFACQKSWRQFSVCKREDIGVFNDSVVSRLDELIANGQVLKDGNSATVAKITLANRDYVIKRYNIKSVAHGLSRFFRRSRAWHSWRSGHCLTILGIKTPEPVLMVEKRLGPFSRRAYLVTEYIDMPDLLKSVERHQKVPDTLGQLANLLKTLLENFNAQLISHGDMKGTNILVGKDELFIIDLDSMQFHRHLQSFSRAADKDRQRLRLNWSEQNNFSQYWK